MQAHNHENQPQLIKQLYKITVTLLLLLAGCSSPINTTVEAQPQTAPPTTTQVENEKERLTITSSYLIENEERLSLLVNRFIQDNHLENQDIPSYRVQIMIIGNETINIFLLSEVPDEFNFVWKGQQVTIIYTP